MAERPFPLNAWYAVAWRHELQKGEIVGRTVCDAKIALWRTSAGAAVAVEDACWHRLMPLSHGRLEGDSLVCRYHGLAFDASGRCVRMPSQEKLNPNACVRSYPIVEKHRLLWVWPGDAAADPALVPDWHWADDPAWERDGATSIGHSAIAVTPAKTTHDERSVTVERWMTDIDAPPFWRTQLGRPGNVDRWQIIRFEPPCTIVLDVGVALAGTGALQGDRSQGVNGRVLNTITPATAKTCMYFWSLVRNYRLRDQTLTTQLRQANARIFEEDRAILEAQQQSIDARPGQALRNLNIDAGSLWARRLIDGLLAREREPHPAEQS
jgi:vanillate O-demethylase monooxygenase subunit